MISLFIWRFFSFLYQFCHNPIPDIRVSVMLSHIVTQYDGKARIKLSDGSYDYIRFHVDKKRFLFLPTKLIIADIFNQLSKMGINSSYITIKHPLWRETTHYRDHVKPYIRTYTGLVAKQRLVAVKM